MNSESHVTAASSHKTTVFIQSHITRLRFAFAYHTAKESSNKGSVKNDNEYLEQAWHTICAVVKYGMDRYFGWHQLFA
jgi:hypothetical protein